MTSQGMAARNRANAQKSTGPRTAVGKATVAQNARRHGVMAKPNPASVAAWLRVILDNPDLTPADLLAEDDRTLRALALAEAEVRVLRAQAALTEIEEGTATASDVTLELQEFAELVFGAPGEQLTKKDLKDAVRTFTLVERSVRDETQPGGKGHRLRKRYLREAQAQRRRAFQAWLACLGENMKEVREAA